MEFYKELSLCSHRFIYSIISLNQNEFLYIYFILVIIVHYYLSSSSNCPRFSHWEFLHLGLYVLAAHPPPFFSTSLYSICIFEHG